MRKLHLALLLCLGLAVAGHAAGGGKDKDKDKDKGDVKRLKGSWQVVSAEFAGQAAKEDAVKSMTFVFDDENLNIKDGTKSRAFPYKLDETKKPTAFDLTFGKKGALCRASTSSKGDNLKICFTAPGEKRPTEFASPKKSQVVLYVLKRAKGE